VPTPTGPIQIATPEPEPIPEPEPEPDCDEDEWPNWIDEAYGPQWWTQPGWGIATTVDGHFQRLGLYFRAPAELLPVAEEMAITNYLGFILPDGLEHHALPVIAAAAEGDQEIQTRIVVALVNRILALRDSGSDLYHDYVARLSDRGLVYDDVTRDIFEQIQTLLAEGNATSTGLFYDLPLDANLIASDIVELFTDRANAEPVDEMLPTLIPAEDMWLFRRNPAALLEAAYLAGTPFYGNWLGDGYESETPIGTVEMYRIAWFLAHTRLFDPVVYAHYHDLLTTAQEQALPEGAQWLLEFLYDRIEVSYNESREWFPV